MPSAADNIKALFKKFDADGDGTISRAELSIVLSRLGKLSALETERIVDEVDQDHNGKIDFDEFLAYVYKGSARLQVVSNQVRIFDFEKALQPLFEVYDKDGSRKISTEEFHECHDILMGAMADEGESCTQMVVGDSRRIFNMIDTDQDKQVSLQEFVAWQREAIEESGISHDDFMCTVEKLSALLQTVRMLHGSQIRKQSKAMSLGFQKQACGEAKKLWQSEPERSSKRTTTNTSPKNGIAEVVVEDDEVVVPEAALDVWREFPSGLSRESLVKHNLRTVRLPLKRGQTVASVSVEQCVPVLDGYSGTGIVNTWYAKVVRHLVQREFGTESVDDMLYFYEFDASKKDGEHWSTLTDDSYYRARASIPVDLRVLAKLVTEADFQHCMPWPSVLNALTICERMSLLRGTDLAKYVKSMEGKAAVELGLEAVADGAPSKSENNSDEVAASGDNAKISSDDAALAERMSKLALAPLQVMAALSDMGVYRQRSLWKSEAIA